MPYFFRKFWRFLKKTGIFLTDKEREYIIDSFGLVGERMVDLKELLHSCGMWYSNKLQNPPSCSEELIPDEEVASSLQNGRPCLDLSISEENGNATAVEREIKGNTTYSHISHLDRARRIQRKDRETLISLKETEKCVENTSMDENEERNLLIAENEDLRQEQPSVEVFDELEDLKFGYYTSNLDKNIDRSEGEEGLLRHETNNNSTYLDNGMEYYCSGVKNIIQSADQSKVTSVPCVV